MIEIIVGLCVGIVFFIAVLKAYILGLKHGKQLGNQIIPTMQINPVKTVIQAVEQYQAKKEEKKVQDELTDIMGATRETMLEAIIKG